MSTAEGTTRPGKREAPPPPISQAEIEAEHDAEIETEFDESTSIPVVDETKKKEAKTDDDRAEKLLDRSRKTRTATPESKAQVRREDQAINDWLGNLRGAGPIQIKLSRTKPVMFNGKNTKGFLQSYEDMITEEEIRDQWGGGEYTLRVQRRNESGTWVFYTSTTCSINGDPRLDNLPGGVQAGPTTVSQSHDESPMLGRAMGFLEKQVETARLEAERARERLSSMPQGPGLEQLMILMKPMELQIAALQRSVDSKDQQISELSQKPANPFQEKLLDKMIDGDSARVNAVREQLQSELRIVRENAHQDEKRLRDSFDRDKQMMVLAHDREISNLKASNDMVSMSIKTSYESQIKHLENEQRRNEREISELRTEVKELRAKKDLGPLEIAKMSETYRDAFGGKDDDSDKSTIEKVADIAMNSDKLFDFASKWLSPKEKKEQAQVQGGQQQQQVQQQKPKFIRKKETGQVFALGPDGEYHPVRRRRTAEGDETDELEEGIDISPDQIAFVVSTLEKAFANGTKPEVVATTARTALPQEILQAIRDHGVDGFLKKVAKLPQASPLARQDGINWIRKVGKALVGDESPDE